MTNGFHVAGIPIIMDTDLPALSWTSLICLGKKTHEKLTNLIEAGLTNMQVLKAGTSLPTKFHNLNNRDVIAPGKRAYLMLVNSDLLVKMSSAP